MERPKAAKKEARWLEAHEVALLLESARTYAPERADRAMPFLFPLLAMFALTGGRESEILGLEVGDVNFDRKTVTFRPNKWRRLKTDTSHRTVPLWPQLEVILRDYLRASGRVEGFLFPRTSRPDRLC
jgi:integrase